MNKLKKLGVAALLGAIVTAGLASPAMADTFGVTLDKSAHLIRTGDSVVATITGLPAGEGIYVRQCVASPTAGVRPTTCAGISDTVWTSTDSTSTAQGASVFTGTVTLPVHLTFTAGNGTAVDCEVSQCGVLVRRDHLDPTDFSLDTFVPISFASVFAVTPSKTTAILNAGEHISVTVAGLTTDQGVYVRLCEQAAVSGDRPTLCDGQGAWVSLSSAMIALGAGNAANPVDVLARANFTAAATKIDCTKVVCGIFVRRDHLAPTDTSLDTFVPVTFSAAVATPVAKKITAVVTKNQVIVSIVGYKGTAVTITVGSTVKTVTPTTNGYTFKVALGKGKKATVKVTKGKSSLFSKKITN